MTVPSLRHRAGKLEIQNRQRELKEKVKQTNIKEEEITPEEHQKRINLLKKIGVLK